ncbi:MAG: DPP IV N-terminal domain-containing protein [Candidatus Poribacteria bacterium]|nr:DPP IV N-terminal domain-containing protein [Candidatus Poribacteria bacterium]
MKRSFVCVMLGALFFSNSILLVNNVQAAKEAVISFLSNEKGDYDIFIINTDGRIRERLATDAMRKSSLTCAPKGYRFAYTSNEHGNLDIYKMDIRNKNPVQLTEHPDRDLWPAWSPNGKWIAFVSDRGGSRDIYRMDVDGSNLIRLTDEGNNGRLAWSPDSQLIAFDSRRGGNHSIYVMDANGGQLKQVTDDLPLWSGCTWSPDGKQIAYAAGILEEGVDIFTIDVDTKNINRLTNMGIGFRSGNPAWSPDGNWIAYSVLQVDELPNPANGFQIIFSDSTIYLIDIQGGIVEPLKKTIDLSSDHVPVWISEDFFSVSPDASKQTVTWGEIKQP